MVLEALVLVPLFSLLQYDKDPILGEMERVPPPPPFLVKIRGLSDEEAGKLKSVAGVQETNIVDGVVCVVWQPYSERPWWLHPPPKFIEKAAEFWPFLGIKEGAGNTRLWSANSVIGRSNSIFEKEWSSQSVIFHHDNLATGQRKDFTIRWHCESLPGQVEHEMLRNVVGTDVSIEPCGKGYVIVSNSGWGTFVVWQVSDQAYGRMDNGFDRDLLAPYIDKLGSVTPRDYKIDPDKWVENEIRWRLQKCDRSYLRRLESRGPICGNDLYVSDINMSFPECGHGEPLRAKLSRELSLKDEHQLLAFTRRWLWANRKNFVYDDGWRCFRLKDRKSLYKPDSPPELPPELKDPTPPDVARKQPSEKTGPLVVLLERRPWAMVLDSDSPTVAIYKDGLVILRDDSGKDHRSYRSTRLEERELRAVVDSLAIEGGLDKLDEYYKCALNKSPPPPFNWIHIWKDGNEKRVGVSAFLRTDTEAREKAPKAYVTAFDKLTSFSHKGLKPWIPDQFQVLMVSYDHSPKEPLEWSSEWPGLSDAKPWGSTDALMLNLDSKHIDEFRKLLDRSQPYQAIKIGDKKWALTYRIPFPHEECWRN